MDQATHNKIVSFIWGIADDVLRDLFRGVGSREQRVQHAEHHPPVPVVQGAERVGIASRDASDEGAVVLGPGVRYELSLGDGSPSARNARTLIRL